MPHLIRLETENGTEVAAISDTHEVLATRADQSSDSRVILARMIDPYGKTVFNRIQLPVLLEELQLLRDPADPVQQQMLDEIAALAKRALEDVHLYITIYGD